MCSCADHPKSLIDQLCWSKLIDRLIGDFDRDNCWNMTLKIAVKKSEKRFKLSKLNIVNCEAIVS